MSLSFPPSPTVGQTYTNGLRTWTWTGVVWELSTANTYPGSITDVELATDSVTTAKIANNAVTTAKIAAGAVTAAKLGNDIQLTPPDGSITTAKIANDAVTTAKLAKEPIYLNGQTISANYSIPAGYNGLSSGPITIAAGVTVTIPAGSSWSIV